jgi:hypothetical protein
MKVHEARQMSIVRGVPTSRPRETSPHTGW